MQETYTLNKKPKTNHFPVETLKMHPETVFIVKIHTYIYRGMMNSQIYIWRHVEQWGS